MEFLAADPLFAAADEMNDFQAVAVVEFRCLPTIARDNVTIQFNRDAVGFHRKGLDEHGESQGFGGFEHAIFSVDLKLHGTGHGRRSVEGPTLGKPRRLGHPPMWIVVPGGAVCGESHFSPNRREVGHPISFRFPRRKALAHRRASCLDPWSYSALRKTNFRVAVRPS
jgi:hypothetical protein